MMVFPIHLRQWGFESVQTLLNSSRRRSTASPYRTRYRYSVTKIKFFTDPLWTKYIKTVLRRQAYRFELRPSGQQLRNLRQFAGSCRFVYTNIREEFRSSSEINKNHVFVEDLPVRNMCKSSKGTGKRVAQKSGLNRAMLDGSPFELRRQLQYKTDWRGGLFYAVPAQNTSRTCPVAWGGCGQVSAENRKDPGEVGMPRMRAVSQCGFDQRGKYPRGVASLSATLACGKCVAAGTQRRYPSLSRGTRRNPRTLARGGPQCLLPTTHSLHVR